MREAIEIVRKLVSGDDSGFDGEVFSLVAGQPLRWKTIRSQIPVLLGTWGERMIANTVDLIDEVKIGGSSEPIAAFCFTMTRARYG